MKFLFIVQGEGRGHMTQAIALSKMLQNQGHELTGVILGKNKRRAIPEFFLREISVKIHLVESPNFVCDQNEKKVLIRKSIVQNLAKSPSFCKSLRKIHQVVKSDPPDIILNFYDLLGGIYMAIFQPRATYWVIGHQYLIDHPGFSFAPSKGLNKLLFKFNTRLTSLGASKKLALSFDFLDSTKKVTVVPPLLREEVKKLFPYSGDFYLTYMVNSGYGEEVISFAKANPSLKIRAYWDKKDADETEYPLANLTFHHIHDTNFLKDMASCKGFVSTAGFESICEAFYLDKPVMLIPIAGQYEQACNALDAKRAGIGIPSENFDFGKFNREMDQLSGDSDSFRSWQHTWPTLLNELIEESASQAIKNKPTRLYLRLNWKL